MNHWHVPDPKIATAKNVAIVKTAPAYLLIVPEVMKIDEGGTFVSEVEWSWHQVGIATADLAGYWPPMLEELAAILRDTYGAAGPAAEGGEVE